METIGTIAVWMILIFLECLGGYIFFGSLYYSWRERRDIKRARCSKRRYQYR